MVKVCVVKSCPSGRKKTKSKLRGMPNPVSFYQPRTPIRLENWKKSLGMELKSTDYVCHLHFKEEHIKIYETLQINGEVKFIPTGRKILKEEAIPTIKHQFNGISPKEHQLLVIKRDDSDNSITKLQDSVNQQDSADFTDCHEQTKSDCKEQELTKEIQKEPIKHPPIKVEVQSIEYFKHNLKDFRMLPECWLHVAKMNSLEFMRIDPTIMQIQNHIRLNADLSITVIYSNKDELLLNEKLNSFYDINDYLKSVEKWPLCVGTQIDNKFSEICRRVIIDIKDQQDPRCGPCQVLHDRLTIHDDTSNILEKPVVPEQQVENITRQHEYRKRMKIRSREKMFMVVQSDCNVEPEETVQKLPTKVQNVVNKCIKTAKINSSKEIEVEANTAEVTSGTLPKTYLKPERTVVDSDHETEEETFHEQSTIASDQTVDNKPYTCDICKKGFINRDRFISHSRTHSRKKVSNRKFTSRDTLKMLKKIHKGDKTYFCHICNKQFTAKQSLVSHNRIHTGEKPFSCGICNKKFVTKSNLRCHSLIHTGEKPYLCDFCCKQFISKQHLIRHIRIHTGERPYLCEVCNKQFVSKPNLRRHILTHTGEKPYLCDICEKQFAVKENLIRHKQTHTGEKPFSCEICEKCFYTKQHLINHNRIHTGERPFSCDTCNKQFARQSNLYNHKKFHTGKKPYACDICNKQFTIKQHLIGHSRIHTGEKPFSCEVCGKRFSIKQNLIRHKRIHAENKPYSCDVCGKQFVGQSNLDKHKRMHASDKPC